MGRLIRTRVASPCPDDPGRIKGDKMDQSLRAIRIIVNLIREAEEVRAATGSVREGVGQILVVSGLLNIADKIEGKVREGLLGGGKEAEK